MKSLRIVFAGTPDFAKPCLEALSLSSHQLIAVYTQPDRPAGRGRKLQASVIKQWAQQHHVPIYQPINFKDATTVSALSALSPDILIVIAYGLILPPEVLTLPTFGCINVHASLLPRWRGASPIQQSILAGDEQIGVTIMQMDAGMDTGPIITQRICPILATDTSATLQITLANLAIEPLLDTMDQLANNNIKITPQTNHGITYAPKIMKQQAMIDWNQSAKQINQQIRAFQPWPVAFTHVNDNVLRIHQAEVVEQISSEPPGTILQFDKTGLLVATSQQSLLIKQVQFPGGKISPVEAYLNASPEFFARHKRLQ